ncbi:3',5'-cyclic adenosine monophosphate phosphodiesterase CpdA [Candidatus Entotheonellaceae bacterium PAL068K]
MQTNLAAQADFYFVHFTDTHVMAGGVHPSTQLDTAASLRQVITVLKDLEPRPAFAVVGGDLVSPDLLMRDTVLTPEAYVPSYRLFQDILRPLPYPIHMLLGNHDNREAFHQVMQAQVVTSEALHYYSFDHQGWHFVALDSLLPGKPGGHLDAGQLAWLRDDLETHRQQPTLVFVHHHPLPVDLAWMDMTVVDNGDELVRVLQPYPNVRWMICGHVHMEHTVQRDGLTMLTTSSTCFQLNQLAQTRQKPFPGPPAFRLVWVQGEHLSTRVIHLHRDHITATTET